MNKVKTKKIILIQSILIIAIMLLQIILPITKVIADDNNLVTIQLHDEALYNAIVEQINEKEEDQWIDIMQSSDDSSQTVVVYANKMNKITYFDLEHRPIENLSGIEGFSELELLYLGYNNFTSIEPITRLKKLDTLFLSGDSIKNITDINKLSTLNSLKLLSCYDAKLQDISFVSTLTNLEELYLTGNKINNISVLSNLTNLKCLSLDENKITNISPLSNLINLKELDLDLNEINDIYPLSNLTNLEKLDLYCNEIKDIRPLAGLTNLKELFLGINKISDVSAISNLTNLEKIGVNSNRIDNLGPITELIENSENEFEINFGGQEIARVNSQSNREIDLPNIFTEAKNGNSFLYSSDEFTLENCTVDENNSKIIINDLNENASVRINSGLVYGSKFTVYPKGYVLEDEDDPINPEPKTEFVIGRDNNSFVHTRNSEYEKAGFVGVTNHKIPKEYYRAITKESTVGEKIATLAKEYSQWHGSCYGIAAMMGLAFYNRIDLNDIESGVSNFNDLDFPYRNKTLLNYIETYYLMQQSGLGSRIDHLHINPQFVNKNNPNDEFNKLEDFLEDFVNITKEEIVQLGYAIPEGGHDILACGCEEQNDGSYRIKLYDMNSVLDDTIGQFKYMTVSSDFKSFSIDNEAVSSSNYEYIRYIRFGDYKTIENIDDEITLRSSNENSISIGFKSGSKFNITNSKNETLTYDGEKLSGNMDVLDVNFISNDENEQEIVVKIADDEKLTFENQAQDKSQNVYISAYDNNHYMSVEGTNVEEAIIDLDKDIKIEGEESSAKIHIDNVNEGLYEINTNIEDEINISRIGSSIKVTGNNEIQNTNIYELTVEDKNELETNISAENIVVDNNNNVTTFNGLLRGDANGDGTVDFKDILAINKHRLKKSLLSPERAQAADVNNDGVADFKDILKINKYRLKKISSLD